MNFTTLDLRTICGGLLMLGLTQCAQQRPFVATSSQVAAHASGLTQGIPNKLKLGYGRREVVHLPEGLNNGDGVAGSLDAEYRSFGGAAISETLSTGEAAKLLVAKEGQPKESKKKKFQSGCGERFVSTNTRFNLGLEGIGVDGAGPSVNFGFRRSILALFAPVNKKCDPALPSTYADVSIHVGRTIPGIPQVDPRGIARERRLSKVVSGARIVQHVATGKAAEYLAASNEARNTYRAKVEAQP